MLGWRLQEELEVIQGTTGRGFTESLGSEQRIYSDLIASPTRRRSRQPTPRSGTTPVIQYSLWMALDRAYNRGFGCVPNQRLGKGRANGLSEHAQPTCQRPQAISRPNKLSTYHRSIMTSSKFQLSLRGMMITVAVCAIIFAFIYYNTIGSFYGPGGELEREYAEAGREWKAAHPGKKRLLLAPPAQTEP